MIIILLEKDRPFSSDESLGVVEVKDDEWEDIPYNVENVE